MARPRKPSNVLALSGAFDKNPNRRRVEPIVDVDLGNAPAHFDEARKAAWAEIIDQAPEGVLTKSDRIAIEMLADLLVRYRASMVPGGKRFISADRRDMLAFLSRFGMTAADRSRVAVNKKDDDQTDIFDVLENIGAA